MIVIDAQNRGLGTRDVLKLMAQTLKDGKKVIVPPAQERNWDRVGARFPNMLGQNELINTYAGLPVQVDADYDATRVGVVDKNEQIIAEIVNLAIPR